MCTIVNTLIQSSGDADHRCVVFSRWCFLVWLCGETGLCFRGWHRSVSESSPAAAGDCGRTRLEVVQVVYFIVFTVFHVQFKIVFHSLQMSSCDIRGTDPFSTVVRSSYSFVVETVLCVCVCFFFNWAKRAASLSWFVCARVPKHKIFVSVQLTSLLVHTHALSNTTHTHTMNRGIQLCVKRLVTHEPMPPRPKTIVFVFRCAVAPPRCAQCPNTVCECVRAVLNYFRSQMLANPDQSTM